MHVHTCMHACVCAHMHACMRMLACVRMFVYMCLFILGALSFYSTSVHVLLCLFVFCSFPLVEHPSSTLLRPITLAEDEGRGRENTTADFLHYPDCLPQTGQLILYSLWIMDPQDCSLLDH